MNKYIKLFLICAALYGVNIFAMQEVTKAKETLILKEALQSLVTVHVQNNTDKPVEVFKSPGYHQLRHIDTIKPGEFQKISIEDTESGEIPHLILDHRREPSRVEILPMAVVWIGSIHQENGQLLLYPRMMLKGYVSEQAIKPRIMEVHIDPIKVFSILVVEVTQDWQTISLKPAQPG